MYTLDLKYGFNPSQQSAKVFMKKGNLPFEVLNGTPGFINLLDALNAWQLVKELKKATGKAAATSFKHVSPAGAAVYSPLNDTLRQIYFAPSGNLSPVAVAYIRARGADRMSSYGDFVAISEKCDLSLANFLKNEVSDGIIAPDYDEDALEVLRSKRKGSYLVLKIDENYTPQKIEERTIFGVTFSQERNEQIIDDNIFKNIPTKNKQITKEAMEDLKIALITLKYTQSNSVCYAKDGQAIGIGAGQQSRIHCTRLAGGKADLWHLRQSEKVLSLPFRYDIKRANRDNAIDIYITEDEPYFLMGDNWQELFTKKPEAFTHKEKRAYLDTIHGVSLASDAFFPFGDNVERARKSGVNFIAQAGGSIRDDHVILTCDKYNIAMALIGFRLFHH